MAARTPSPSETFTGLREELFGSDLAALAPADEGMPFNLLGVVMECWIDGGSYLSTVFATDPRVCI